MRKKGALVAIILLISLFAISSNLVSADAGDSCSINSDCGENEICANNKCELENADTSTSAEDRGYSCLKSEVKDKCSSLGMEAQAFSLLALAHDSSIQSECEDALLASSKNNECWPAGSAGCKLRETSLAILALENINYGTSASENWLLNQTKAPDLEWFLEIDSSKATACTIKYSGSSHSINIGEDKKISGSAGNCFSSARSGYWLQIDDNCFSKNFTVSCNEDFITALLYKKPGDDVWHVSSETSSASASGETTEIVNAFCFKQNNNCNFEGSLWATLALISTGHDKEAYLPYLVAYADNNKPLAPDAFLLLFTDFPDYLSNIISSQNTQGYWDLDSPYDSLYDTALNLLALTSTTSSTDSIDSSKVWLENIQKANGCWDSTRNTAFILYAVWGRPAASNYQPDDDCEDNGNYCITSGECSEASGKVLTNFDCDAINEVCCDKPAKQETCLEKNGEICPSGQVCSTSAIQASDTPNCCISSCQPISQVNDCEDAGYTCKFECSSDEEKKAGYSDCSGGDVCCAPKTPDKSYWWIWLLIILIILLVLGIILRDRLKMSVFKFKNKFKSGKAETNKPGFPPSQPRMMLPVFRRQIQGRTKPRPSSGLDKELDETLKKLREIGK